MKLSVVLAWEQLGKGDRLSCLNSCISPGCRISEEISPCMHIARLALISLRHFERQRDIRLSIEGRVTNSETWPLRMDAQRVSMFEQCCFPCIGIMWLGNFVSTS